MSAPAKRALERAGVNKVEDLARFTQREVLSWHGMGKASLPKMRAALNEAGLDFKSE